ncbi:MAG: glucose-6-phosphate dehydrogenase assembly protein OpcA [Acidobacteriota bacterium]|nr:glucose-6-phosphate dehydrogenase assembly protein OpcA [Acidobacteriota bacterium]
MSDRSMGRVQVPDIGAIEKELAEFWRGAFSDEQPVLRASMVNLVVACEDSASVAEASTTIARLSEHLPGRAIVISAEPAGGDEGKLDAWVSTHCHRGPGGSQVCSEQVTLAASGEASSHVPETVLQLLLEDTPVVTWWRRRKMLSDPLCHPLARLSDRFVVDSSMFDEPREALADLATIAADPSCRGSVGDLVWMRSEAWREHVASLFDGFAFREHLARVTRMHAACGGPAAAAGFTVAGGYFVGWMASRLGWRFEGKGRCSRRDGRTLALTLAHDPAFPTGRIAAIRIETSDGEPPAVFSVERAGPEKDSLRVRIDTARTCPLPHTKKLTRMSEGALLCGELQRDAGDPLFEESLACAAKLAAAE